MFFVHQTGQECQIPSKCPFPPRVPSLHIKPKIMLRQFSLIWSKQPYSKFTCRGSETAKLRLRPCQTWVAWVPLGQLAASNGQLLARAQALAKSSSLVAGPTPVERPSLKARARDLLRLGSPVWRGKGSAVPYACVKVAGPSAPSIGKEFAVGRLSEGEPLPRASQTSSPPVGRAGPGNIQLAVGGKSFHSDRPLRAVVSMANPNP